MSKVVHKSNIKNNTYNLSHELPNKLKLSGNIGR